MTGAEDARRQAVAALARDPALARAAGEGAALLVLSPDGAVLWRSPGAEQVQGLVRPGSGDLAIGPLPAQRIGSLLAQFERVGTPVLERVRLGGLGSFGPETLLCRAVDLDPEHQALAAVVVGRRGESVDLAALSVEASAEEAAPSGLDGLRQLAAGRGLLRFLWQAGADGRFLTVRGGLGEATRQQLPEPAAHTWIDLVAQGVVDPEDATAAALRRPETFHGVASLWPLRDGSGLMRLTLSGVPVTAADGSFGGHRGFGLCHLDRLEPAPARPPAVAEPASPAPQQLEDAPPLVGSSPGHEFAAASEAAVDDPFDGAHHLEPASGITLDDADAPPDDATPEVGDEQPTTPEQASQRLPEPDAGSPSVVPFERPRPAGAGASGGKVVTLRSTAPPAPDPRGAGLSRSERNAFREIARALGARIEGESAPPPPAPPPLSPIAPAGETAPPVAAVAAEPARSEASPAESGFGSRAAVLLDRIPVGVLVCRGERALALNRTLLDLLDYRDLAEFEAMGGLSRTFRGRPPELLMQGDGGTVAIAARDGEIIGVDVRVQVTDWDGGPAMLLSFRRAADPDSGPRLKALELDLRRRESDVRELRAILDTATDGVVVLDEAGRILSINRSGEALFGYDQNEVAGEAFISLLAPESHSAALDYMEGLRTDGVASVLNDGREVVGRVRQGGRIPLFLTLGRISDEPERKFCAVLRDITPWKRAEADLLDAKRAAERASAQKSDFLAKISHEIRTPLSAIIGFAEVMMEERFGAIGNERYKDYLKDIHASGGHVISLVNDLLDLSKIEAGRFELNFTSVDMNEVVSGGVSLLQPQAAEARVVVRSALAARLPRVVADERSLKQIVINILSNAVKFTDPGGQVIVSTAFNDRGEVVLRVRDTGIGMSEEEIETALEPFRQITTAGRTGTGTGLGLPLTKALVEANRASLMIRSAKQAGTMIEVVFPPTRVLAE
jgi:PAS domain S-box-containing protein